MLIPPSHIVVEFIAMCSESDAIASLWSMYVILDQYILGNFLHLYPCIVLKLMYIHLRESKFVITFNFWRLHDCAHLKGIKNLELNKRRGLNRKRIDGIQVMRKLAKVIQGKDEGEKMWLESVVNENMEKDLAGFMSQDWDKCEGIP